ncbi:MAG: hypothetical protein DME18_07570 [Verrucomicrobia bacterium]|nr:MAG: hypothetical protein DME18_07570 [Verrucomicrobiota bacterium]
MPAAIETSAGRRGDETVREPAFGGAVFSARVQAEPCPAAREREFLICGGDLCFGHFEKRRQRFGVGAERGDEVKVLVNVMGARRWGTGDGGGSGDEFLDFGERPFAHGDGVGSRKDAGCQKTIPPRTRVADAMRNSRQPKLQRGAMRIRQRETDLEISRPHFFRDRPEGVAR